MKQPPTDQTEKLDEKDPQKSPGRNDPLNIPDAPDPRQSCHQLLPVLADVTEGDEAASSPSVGLGGGLGGRGIPNASSNEVYVGSGGRTGRAAAEEDEAEDDNCESETGDASLIALSPASCSSSSASLPTTAATSRPLRVSSNAPEDKSCVTRGVRTSPRFLPSDLRLPGIEPPPNAAASAGSSSSPSPQRPESCGIDTDRGPWPLLTPAPAVAPANAPAPSPRDSGDASGEGSDSAARWRCLCWSGPAPTTGFIVDMANLDKIGDRTAAGAPAEGEGRADEAVEAGEDADADADAGSEPPEVEVGVASPVKSAEAEVATLRDLRFFGSPERDVRRDDGVEVAGMASPVVLNAGSDESGTGQYTPSART